MNALGSQRRPNRRRARGKKLKGSESSALAYNSLPLSGGDSKKLVKVFAYPLPAFPEAIYFIIIKFVGADAALRHILTSFARDD